MSKLKTARPTAAQQAGEVARVRELAQRSPEIRAERVQQAMESLASGTYMSDKVADAIADKIADALIR